VFTDVADLVCELSYGIARQMPVDALPRIGGRPNRPVAIDILVGPLADDDVTLHAISAVRRIRANEARPALTRLFDHDHDHDTIRRRARHAIARLP
jgi:hypothetical protein